MWTKVALSVAANFIYGNKSICAFLLPFFSSLKFLLLMINKFFLSVLLLLACGISQCNAAQILKCSLLESARVDLSKYYNPVFTGCTISAPVELDTGSRAGVEVWFFKTTFVRTGAVTLTDTSLGKNSGLRFYETLAGGPFINSINGATLEGVHISIISVAIPQSALLPESVSLVSTNERRASIFIKSSSLGSIGGLFQTAGFIYLEESTVSTLSLFSDVMVLLKKSSTDTLSPSVLLDKMKVVFDAGTLGSCGTRASNPLYFLDASKVSSLIDSTSCGAVASRETTFPTSTIPSGTVYVDYQIHGTALCEFGTPAKDGCSCNYGTLAYCTPVQLPTYTKPAKCQEGFYDVCLDSFGGTSSFTKYAGILTLLAAVVFAL